MKISYNAPTILTFALAATAVMVLKSIFGDAWGPAEAWFSAPPFFQPGNPRFYTGLLGHPFAHADWNHLVGNFSMILLIGPILEEKYGSKDLLFMILVTSVFTGIINSLLFDTGLIGASGIVFMLILLSSFSNMKEGKIPVTFILVVMIFLGGEVYEGLFAKDNISHFAHILGGIIGGAFGFLIERKKS